MNVNTVEIHYVTDLTKPLWGNSEICGRDLGTMELRKRAKKLNSVKFE